VKGIKFSIAEHIPKHVPAMYFRQLPRLDNKKWVAGGLLLSEALGSNSGYPRVSV